MGREMEMEMKREMDMDMDMEMEKNGDGEGERGRGRGGRGRKGGNGGVRKLHRPCGRAALRLGGSQGRRLGGNAFEPTARGRAFDTRYPRGGGLLILDTRAGTGV